MKPWILLLCVCMLSCNTPNSFRGKHKFIDKFPVYIHLDAEEEFSVEDMDALGMVDLYIADTVLIALLFKSDVILKGFGLPNLNSLGSLINKGQGPDEFLWVGTSQQCLVDSGEIKVWSFDSQLSRFFLLNVTKTVQQHKTVVDKAFDLKKLGYTSNWIYVNDSLFWGMNITMDNLELISYNVEKDIISYREPLFDTPHDIVKYPQATSDIVIVKPDLSKIVLDMLYLDQLHIISLDNTADRISFSTTDHAVNFDHFQGDVTKLPIYYHDIRATNELIFANYTKKSVNDELNEDKTIIHVFDWDGNPKFCLDMPHFTPYFAIDEKGGYLYALSSEDERLYRYNIKAILNE
ncbi:hypothetical protein FACS189430_00670 [Bacteroidia bacterium]|nr:hypothetical protein FACS189430_00670 [Bacteroidia bacterium]